MPIELGDNPKHSLDYHYDHDPNWGPGPAPGETVEQHRLHLSTYVKKHWGLPAREEEFLFYTLAILSWCCELAGCVLASYYKSDNYAAIGTVTAWLVLWAAAWLQTVVGMCQRASWVRDEADLKDRRQFLHFAVRLTRLMLPTAIIAFVTFIVAYVRRHNTDDIAGWLIFLIFFIFNTVGCVMNAYNNITWECDRLHYEEGEPPYKYTRLAILGIAS